MANNSSMKTTETERFADFIVEAMITLTANNNSEVAVRAVLQQLNRFLSTASCKTTRALKIPKKIRTRADHARVCEYIETLYEEIVKTQRAQRKPLASAVANSMKARG